MKLARIFRVAGAFAVVAAVAALAPDLAHAGTATGPAAQHFGFLSTIKAGAQGVVGILGLLAIVGGIVMWGIGGGQEGVMKKVGPVVAAFGVAATILQQGNFFGVGGAGF